MDNVVGIIPARGGSKTVPNKNIRLLAGKPLIYYTIAEALKSAYIKRIIVSTDDRKIAAVARRYGAEVIERPEELARDDTPMLPAIQHAVRTLEEKEHYQPDVVVLLQPTSPLRTVADIDGAIEKFRKTTCTSVVSVCEIDYPLHWMYTLDGDRLKPIVAEGEEITRRQDAPRTYRFNGAVYVLHCDTLLKEDSLLGNDIRAYIMPPERSVDIDTMLDFKLAEILLRHNI